MAGGAGSGRTTALVERYLALVDEGHRPSSVLVVCADRGAAGRFRQRVLPRLAGGFDARAEVFAASRALSVDVTHAAHPNYLGHHDPGHRAVPNGGPALKVNANQRYATDAPGAAAWIAHTRGRQRRCDGAPS